MFRNLPSGIGLAALLFALGANPALNAREPSAAAMKEFLAANGATRSTGGRAWQ